jgi:hypothetical protein
MLAIGCWLLVIGMAGGEWFWLAILMSNESVFVKAPIPRPLPPK